MTKRSATAASPPSQGPVRDRVVELRRMRAGDLGENPKNWRRHPDHQRRALQEMLVRIGYADALLAYPGEGGTLVLVDGHLRQSLDPDQIVPVLVLDLSAEEADALLLTLDPLAALAVADPERLGALLADVDASSSAVRDFLDGLARAAGLPLVRGFRDPEEIPPAPPEPVTKRGDLYALGEHRILCGDATDRGDVARATDGRPVSAMWTDPPYGVDYTGKTDRALTLTGDRLVGLRRLLDAAFVVADGVLAPGAAIYVAHPAGRGQSTFLDAFGTPGWELRQNLVWVKDAFVLGRSDYHYRHEPIAYGRKRGSRGRWGRGHAGWYGGNAESSVLEIPRPRASREHPTAKPVELVRRCLSNSAAPGTTVLDPFLGSGSTLIAAEELGLDCIGVEIDPAYVDVSVARWEAFTGRTAERI